MTWKVGAKKCAKKQKMIGSFRKDRSDGMEEKNEGRGSGRKQS